MPDVRPSLPPRAPTPPEPGDCCNSGCARCVYVVYEEELETYREALRQWEADRNAATAVKRARSKSGRSGKR